MSDPYVAGCDVEECVYNKNFNCTYVKSIWIGDDGKCCDQKNRED